MPIILEALRQEHRNTAELLDVLEHEIASLAGDPDWDVINGIANYFCDYPDRCHHPKEDTIFRRLQALFPEQAISIGNLLSEHQEVRLRAERFRGHVQSIFLEAVFPREELIASARGFIDAERLHMMKEEKMFLPAAEKLLVKEDWKWIESQLQSEFDPLFQESIERDFETLRDQLLAWEIRHRIS